jgi:hypothetical protein
MSQTLILFLIAGGLACTVLGVAIGRLITLKGFNWNLKDVIGVALIGAFIAVIFILFWKEIPKSNEQLLVYMLGQLSGFVAGVVSSHYVNKAGEDRLAQARNDTTKALAEAVTAASAATPAKDGGDARAARDVANAADERAEDYEQRGGS